MPPHPPMFKATEGDPVCLTARCARPSVPRESFQVSAAWSPCELVRLSSWEPDLGFWQIPQGPDPMGVHLGGCQPACPDHTPSLLPGLTAPHSASLTGCAGTPGDRLAQGLAPSNPK